MLILVANQNYGSVGPCGGIKGCLFLAQIAAAIVAACYSWNEVAKGCRDGKDGSKSGKMLNIYAIITVAIYSLVIVVGIIISQTCPKAAWKYIDNTPPQENEIAPAPMK